MYVLCKLYIIYKKVFKLWMNSELCGRNKPDCFKIYTRSVHFLAYQKEFWEHQRASVKMFVVTICTHCQLHVPAPL